MADIPANPIKLEAHTYPYEYDYSFLLGNTGSK